MAGVTSEVKFARDFNLNWTINGSLFDLMSTLEISPNITKEFVSDTIPKYKWEIRIEDSQSVSGQGGYEMKRSRIFLKLLKCGVMRRRRRSLEKFRKMKFKCEGSINWTQANKPELKEFDGNNFDMDEDGFVEQEIRIAVLPHLKKFSDLSDLHIKCHIQADPQIITTRNSNRKRTLEEDYIIYKKPEPLKLNEISAGKKAKILSKVLEQSPDEIEVICKEAKFKIHKSLLTAQSEVFTKMFEVDLTENQEDRIIIEDFEPEVVQVFLDYLRNVSTPWEIEIGEMTMELFMMSHKYEIDDLKTHCEALLSQKITLENAIEMLELAKIYNLSQLEDSAMKFIIIKKDTLGEMKEFDRLAQENPKLMDEIKSKFWKNYSIG